MGCVEAHYGKLPILFIRIVESDRFKFYNELMFDIFRRLYVQSKNLISNKTCEGGGFIVSFIDVSLKFLYTGICKLFQSFEEIVQEATILREILNQQLEISDGKRYYLSARIFFLEGNYLNAICDAEFVTSDNTEFFFKSHLLKMECYIKLKNKLMAKKVLKKLKTFNHMKFSFDDLEKEIENIIPIEDKNCRK